MKISNVEGENGNHWIYRFNLWLLGVLRNSERTFRWMFRLSRAFIAFWDNRQKQVGRPVFDANDSVFDPCRLCTDSGGFILCGAYSSFVFWAFRIRMDRVVDLFHLFVL